MSDREDRDDLNDVLRFERSLPFVFRFFLAPIGRLARLRDAPLDGALFAATVLGSCVAWRPR